MSSSFGERFRGIARRFLVSAAVVDDEPYYDEAGAIGPLRTPSRADRRVEDESPSGRFRGRNLDAGAITEAFSRVGVICGIVKPARDEKVSIETVKRADLVVIDWRLHGDDGERALELLRSIVVGDQGQRLRLIAVYTGESKIDEIGGRIRQELGRNGRKFESEEKDDPVELSCGHCHIVIYAKSNTPLGRELKSRSVSEEDLPERLIDDFARMTEGLLSGIAFVALAAVRENAHRVLDKFESKLDPAFLTHRACLPVPDDSEGHIVAQIASELRAIMEEEVNRIRPSGMEAIGLWMTKFKGNGDVMFGGNPLSQKRVLEVLGKGVDATDVPSKSKAYSLLTAGLVNNEDGEKNLDLRLAWMTCFRAIDPPDKKLWLGTVVRRCGESNCVEFLLCVRPRCDSVRMDEPKSFLFLPLIDHKAKTFQLVVRLSSNGLEYKRFSVDFDMAKWKLLEFGPDPAAKAVVAQEEETGRYVFADVPGERYEWIGELKAEVAHSIGQLLGATLSRIALDRSEWLRRSERSG